MGVIPESATPTTSTRFWPLVTELLYVVKASDAAVDETFALRASSYLLVVFSDIQAVSHASKTQLSHIETVCKLDDDAVSSCSLASCAKPARSFQSEACASSFSARSNDTGSQAHLVCS